MEHPGWGPLASSCLPGRKSLWMYAESGALFSSNQRTIVCWTFLLSLGSFLLNSYINYAQILFFLALNILMQKVFPLLQTVPPPPPTPHAPLPKKQTNKTKQKQTNKQTNKKTGGHTQPLLLLNKEIPLQRSVSAGCQNYTQLQKM